jgi:predicted PurR-regulated permease PerM
MFGKLNQRTVREINISNSTLVRVMAIVIGFFLLLGFIYVARQPLMLILISAFLALALSPPVNLIARKIPGNSRGLATAISYIIILSIISFVLYLLIPPLMRQSELLINNFPQYIREIENGRDFVSEFVREYQLQDQLQKLQSELSSRYGQIGGSVIDLVRGVFSNVASILTVMIVAFFMLVEGPEWIRRFWELQPVHNRKRHQEVAQKMYGVITGFVNGQLLVALLSAVSSFVMLTIVGVDAALPLAVVVGLFGLIPFIGATIGAIVVVLAALFTSTTAAIIMTVFFIIYQQFENNVIQPIVQSRTTEASPLLVLIATIVGVFVGGLLGAILAVPVAGCLRILVNDYIDKHNLIHETK